MKVRGLIKICIYFNSARTVEMAGQSDRPLGQDNAICLQPPACAHTYTHTWTFAPLQSFPTPLDSRPYVLDLSVSLARLPSRGGYVYERDFQLKVRKASRAREPSTK